MLLKGSAASRSGKLKFKMTSYGREPEGSLDVILVERSRDHTAMQVKKRFFLEVSHFRFKFLCNLTVDEN